MQLLTEVVIVPAATGPTVPVAALRTGPDGGTTVTRVVPEGTELAEVKVLAVANGLAVVEGLEAGDTVLVLTEYADE